VCFELQQRARQHQFACADCRALRDTDSELKQAPRRWLDRLLGHMRRPGQSLSDIVRRSAGIPFACTGLFQADMSSARKVHHGHG